VACDAAFAGDANADGGVDFADLAALGQNCNTGAAQAAGTLPTGAATDVASDWAAARAGVVPEPGVCGLIGVGLSLLTLAR
jgi:hypothetical protein